MAKACAQGKIGATNIHAKIKKSKTVVTKPKPKVFKPKVHEYEQDGKVSKQTIKSWLTVERDHRLYARGIVIGLQIMAARGISTQASQWGLAKIIGHDKTKANRWIVKFESDRKCFGRTLGFHQFKLAARIHVKDDSHRLGYSVATIHPPKWITPVHVSSNSATALCSLL